VYDKFQKIDINIVSMRMYYKMSFSDQSYSLTKGISKDEKKNNGIYFTPPSTIEKNLEILKQMGTEVRKILEPSCGSCEYVRQLIEVYPDAELTAIEYNRTIYEKMKSTYSIMCEDYLKFETQEKYDLIIGNPPYYVLEKSSVDSYYEGYYDGRPNIFILFIIKSLCLLADNGVLSFVLPKSFLNCLYYEKTRKYIHENYLVYDLRGNDDKYIETQQETITLVIQKTAPKPESPFVYCGYNTVFGTSENIERIRELYTGSTTLHSMGFKVSVGNVVWNQHKKILTDDSSKTRLIYSSDIVNNRLTMKTFANEQKKNYIDRPGINEPTLLINRGYGVGKYMFSYCLLEGDFEYLAENHLMCIKYVSEGVEKEELIVRYKKIMASLDDSRTKDFVNIYFGNSAINTTELTRILPIYEI